MSLNFRTGSCFSGSRTRSSSSIFCPGRTAAGFAESFSGYSTGVRMPGSRSMPHLEHFPGPLARISGSMGQDHSTGSAVGSWALSRSSERRIRPALAAKAKHFGKRNFDIGIMRSQDAVFNFVNALDGVNVMMLRPGIQHPNVIHAGFEVVRNLFLHVVDAVVRGDNLDHQVRSRSHSFAIGLGSGHQADIGNPEAPGPYLDAHSRARPVLRI